MVSWRTINEQAISKRSLIVIYLCLIGFFAEPAFCLQQQGQQLAEGLGIEQTGKQQQQWPLDQLERIKSESRVSALVGQNVILNCAVQFKDGIEKPFVVNWLKYPHKLPIYIWYAGYPPHVAQGYENRVSRIGQASLNLSRVRETDQGLYECKIYYLDRRPEDKTNGTWIYLDVQAPPHFTRTPAPVNYVQAGDSLRLTCQAESTPTPILRWYKNKVPIDSDSGAYRLSSSLRGDDEQEAPAGSQDQISQLDLFIDNVQAGATTGDYACLASNSEGSVEARSQVVLAVPAVIVQVPRNQTRLEGDKAELTCQAKALPSNITYKWFFNDQPIQQLKWFDSRHSVRRDGTLVIHSVQRDDEGVYKCQATNGLAHRTTSPAPTPAPIYAEATAQLTIEYPARIAYSPSVQYLPLGMSGQIRCHVQAAPALHWSAWTLNEQQFDPNADPNIEPLQNGSLLIRQVTKQYEGKYRCTAFNKHGSAGSSGQMEVRVEEPPKFELRPAHFYKAHLNGQVRIPCEASGSHKPSVYWRRPLGVEQHAVKPERPLADEAEDSDHQPHLPEAPAAQEPQPAVIEYAKLPSDRSEYKNSYLLLHGLRKEDHGRYECVIENEVATLVASTMLYIEETTPHAPTNVQVETKAWSAQVSWTPGYDGGFEQSFVLWYRQVDRPGSRQQPPQSNLPQPVSPASLALGGQPEAVDLNWRSVGIQPPEATSFTLHNLSQDTSYEFCVRAKNIIGEGPRSQVVTATTKRAVSGSLAPAGDAISANSQASTQAEGAVEALAPPVADDEEQEATVNPSVLGIIHLVDATSLPPINSSQQQEASTVQPPESSSEPGKVIRIFFPAKQLAANGSDLASKRQAGNSSAPQGDQTQPQVPSPQVDQSTAPQNLSMMKVAQGWVLNWAAPQRIVSEPSAAERVEALASQSATRGHLMPPILAQQLQPAGSAQPAAYSVEFREKGGAWQSLASSSERSLLLKDLKPGSEYMFRVYAHSATGSRGAPSAEFRYHIPDNRRKPGSTQALSAGVVSGILFFIACIVIAVCAVNMCNKRRKKRAEKAAYVMMACPVLESHQDLAALNSNSLVKNRADAAKSRISGVKSSLARLSLTLRSLKDNVLGVAESPPPPEGSPVHQVNVRYSANEPLAVDVAQQPPDDDYWVRRPSDRKWGTLTLAASKLAERRAAEAARHQAPATDPAGYWLPELEEPQSRTLPRSFAAASFGQSSQEQQFSAWLQAQCGVTQPVLAGPTQVAPTESRLEWAAAQPQQLHQRSISQVEPSVANYLWLVRQRQQQWRLQQQCYPEPQQVCSLWPEETPDAVAELGKRHSLARSTLPIAHACCPFYPPLFAATGQPPQLVDDDPLTANACLGSYKRKRRLPHIEAQFTIEPPPELPPKTQTDGPAEADGRAEREAVASGRLFVRGLPPAGQRSEQRRLRPGPPLDRVETIGAREKIDAYLRHYDERPPEEPEEDSDEKQQAVELEQLQQLTFQPYHNLPQLKYTISLPIYRDRDGKLLLAETSHLRPASRSAPARPVRAKPRLGSSSSCPAPPTAPSASARRSSSLEGALSRPGPPPWSRLLSLNESKLTDSLEHDIGQPVEQPNQPFYLRSPNGSSAADYASVQNQPVAPAPPVPPHRSSTKSWSPNTNTNTNSSSSVSSESQLQLENGQSPEGTNDQSVDENYEFDLSSSCSSSTRRQRNQLGGRANGAQDTYPSRKQVVVLERTHYYEQAGQKEISLECSYDTVCEVSTQSAQHQDAQQTDR